MPNQQKQNNSLATHLNLLIILTITND